MVNGHKKCCLDKHSRWMECNAQWGSHDGVVGIIVWMGDEKLRLNRASKNFTWTGCQKTLFGMGIEKLCLDRASKTLLGPGIKKHCLDGH